MTDFQRTLVMQARVRFLRRCTPLVIKPLQPMHVAILRLQASR